MAKKIILFITLRLLSGISAFNFEQNSVLNQASFRDAFEVSADSSAKSFDEQTCTNQLNLFSDALANRDFWALRSKFKSL